LTQLIDSHIHLDDARFDHDRNELINRAKLSGVSRFIVPAVSVNKFPAVLNLAKEHEDSGAVGVGECGLDFYLKDLDRDKQKLVFEAQVVLAKHFDLPLVLHVRGAVDEVFKILKKHNYYKAVMHSFNGSIEQAKQIISQGVYLGFGPAVCNPQAHKLKQMIQYVPIESILLETDAPDQPFYDRHGKRNLPMDLLRVNQEIAAIKKIKPELLATQTTVNVKKLFVGL